uniref:Cytochrome P450 n=1 Tax=Timema cristinae TaxID=61476 RepID=A0A7R9GTC1_TIMCR|nr:unnamed protein product [Timema cristinae]
MHKTAVRYVFWFDRNPVFICPDDPTAAYSCVISPASDPIDLSAPLVLQMILKLCYLLPCSSCVSDDPTAVLSPASDPNDLSAPLVLQMILQLLTAVLSLLPCSSCVSDDPTAVLSPASDLNDLSAPLVLQMILQLCTAVLSLLPVGSVTSALLVVMVVSLMVYNKRRARLVSLINRIPGPPALPFIGNTIELNVEHDAVDFASLTKPKCVVMSYCRDEGIFKALGPVECKSRTYFVVWWAERVKGVAWLHNRPKYPSAPTRTDGSRKQ